MKDVIMSVTSASWLSTARGATLGDVGATPAFI